MYFEYKAVFYDEDKEEESVETGIVFGASYGEAAEKVYQGFQETLIGMSLIAHEDCATFALTGKFRESLTYGLVTYEITEKE